MTLVEFRYLRRLEMPTMFDGREGLLHLVTEDTFLTKNWGCFLIYFLIATNLGTFKKAFISQNCMFGGQNNSKIKKKEKKKEHEI